MKISDTNALAPVAVAPRQVRSPEAPSPADVPTPADKVSSPDAERVARSLAVVRQAAGTNRSVRLQELEAAIRSGAYQPDAGRIAEQILDAATLDARLEAMLRR